LSAGRKVVGSVREEGEEWRIIKEGRRDFEHQGGEANAAVAWCGNFRRSLVGPWEQVLERRGWRNRLGDVFVEGHASGPRAGLPRIPGGAQDHRFVEPPAGQTPMAANGRIKPRVS